MKAAGADRCALSACRATGTSLESPRPHMGAQHYTPQYHAELVGLLRVRERCEHASAVAADEDPGMGGRRHLQLGRLEGVSKSASPSARALAAELEARGISRQGESAPAQRTLQDWLAQAAA